jgi:hypothetical protein
MPRVRSGSNLSALLVDSKTDDIKSKERQFREEVGPDYGFDLSKIRSHYESRMKLRASKMVLRYGELCPLMAKNEEVYGGNENAFLDDVLTFSRYSLMETAVIAINVSSKDKTFFVDLEKLYNTFRKTLGENTVIMTQNLLEAKNQAK